MSTPEDRSLWTSENVEIVRRLSEAGTARIGPEMVSHQLPSPGSPDTSSQAKHSVSCKSGYILPPSLPTQKLPLYLVGITSTFCSKFISLVRAGGQEAVAIRLTPR